MSVLTGPTVRDDGAGNAVLVKHAAGAERLRLHHEAQVLAAARMDGVVECVGLEEFGERCELRLRYIEAATLAELPPLRPDDLLDVLIDVGTTLAELHARGIRHGALRADHVLLARPCRPVLCGFGEATGPSDRSQHPPSADLTALAALAASQLTRADQAAAEAAERQSCAEALLAAKNLAVASDSPHGDSEPLAEWLARMRHIRDATGYEMPAASRDAGLASAAGPARRQVVSYAAAAAALCVAAVIGWRVLSGGGPDADAPADLAPVAAARIAVTTPAAADAEPAQLGTAAEPGGSSDAGLGTVDGRDASGGLPGSTAPADTGSAEPTEASESARLLYSTSSPGCPERAEAVPSLDHRGESDLGERGPDADAAPDDRVRAVHRADVVGSGCPEAVYIEAPDDHGAAAAVRTSHGEWTAGAPGDLVTVGDWDCDGRATLAVLSPATGLVSFYATWPRSERPVLPARFAHVPAQAAAVSVAAPADASAETQQTDAAGDGDARPACDELVVRYGDLSLTLRQSESAANAPLWLTRR